MCDILCQICAELQVRRQQIATLSFGMTHPKVKPQIYRMQSERSTHYGIGITGTPLHQSELIFQCNSRPQQDTVNAIKKLKCFKQPFLKHSTVDHQCMLKIHQDSCAWFHRKVQDPGNVFNHFRPCTIQTNNSIHL